MAVLQRIAVFYAEGVLHWGDVCCRRSSSTLQISGRYRLSVVIGLVSRPDPQRERNTFCCKSRTDPLCQSQAWYKADDIFDIPEIAMMSDAPLLVE